MALIGAQWFHLYIACETGLRVRLDWVIFELMQINKLLCIIHNHVKVVYQKTAYEDTIFGSENLWINIKAYLFA
jgi:hypothetical protein